MAGQCKATILGEPLGSAVGRSVLTDLQCRKAAARDKPYKLTDANGLYLYVTPAGAKSWRLKYRLGTRPDGKPGQVERKLVFGSHPEMPLQEARDARDAAQKLLFSARESTQACGGGSDRPPRR